MQKKWLFFFFFILLASDALLKFLVVRTIPLMSLVNPLYPFGGIGVFEGFFGITFAITHVENLGAAWGVFSSYPHLLLLFRLVVCVGLFVYLFKKKEKTGLWALLLIVSGAVGNILDFFLYGHVIDMFYFIFFGYSYPIFNLADVYIVLGVLFFVFFSRKKKS